MEENRKQEKSAGDDWRYAKGHLNPYYSWYQKGETLFSPLYWVHFVVTPFDYKNANLFPFSLFSVSVRFKLCSVLLIWIHRRNTRYFFGILGNNSLLLESNELPRCFFYYYKLSNLTERKGKEERESTTRHRSGWAMWYNVYLNPYIITECEFLCSVKIEGQFV